MIFSDWPLALLPGFTASRVARLSRMGPEPIDTAPLSVSSPTARWLVTYRGVRVVTPAHLSMFHGLFALPGGAKANPLFLCPFDRLRLAPRPLAGLPSCATLSPFSDGATLSDGSLFLTTPVDFQLAAAASAGDTALVVSALTAGPVLAPGACFTLGAGDNRRMHQVARVLPDDTTPGQFNVTITPKLRAAAAVGDPLDFANPRVPCVLVGDDPALALERNWSGYVDLEFQEIPWA